jgi:DNA replication ATP-dependent helicase Dna2
MIQLQQEVLNAIEAEQRATPSFLLFVVRQSEREGKVWKVLISPEDSFGKGLDESMEGSAAWWPGPPKGGADVLSVDPENDQINLRYATDEPPVPDQKIWIFPPSYLEALHACWSANTWAEQCQAWLGQAVSNSFDETEVVSSKLFSWLRPQQGKAFQLVGWKVGFLWGPPGTGKTRTLGALLASYLLQFPTKKVLLLSTTNAAVDLALTATDRALEELSKHPAASTASELGTTSSPPTIRAVSTSFR